MDQLTDKTKAGLFAIANVCELPDFVKTAATVRSADGVSSEHFGDPHKRQYPCHTPEDTWLSSAYYSLYDNGNEKIASNIGRMAKYWNVELPVLTQVDKEAANAVDIKYTFENVVHDTVQVHSLSDLAKVASDLSDNAARYPYDMRMSVAKQILGAAKSMKGSLPTPAVQSLHKMAGYGVGSLADAEKVMESRLNICRRYKIMDRVENIKASLYKQAEDDILPPASLVKVARFADAVDRLSKQHKQYGKGYERPEESLFSVTMRDMDEMEKRAGFLQDGTAITAKQVRKPEVRKMVSGFVGEKVAYDALFQLVQTLPVTQCRLLSRVLG